MSLVNIFNYEPVEPTIKEKKQTWSDIKKHLPEFSIFMIDLKKQFCEIIKVEIKLSE